VPIFDTLMAICRRKLTGRSIAAADRGHIHHCLLDRGLSGRQTLLVLAAICAVMALATVASAYLNNDIIAFASCSAVLVLLIIARVFGYRETLLLYGHAQQAAGTLLGASEMLRARFALSRLAQVRPEHRAALWAEVKKRMLTAGGASLELLCRDARDKGPHYELHWTRDGDALPENRAWQLQLIVPRNDQRHAHVFARGCDGTEPSAQKLGQLAALLTIFGHHWPLEGEPLSDAREQHAVPSANIGIHDAARARAA
jgi:UDP-GlcNAc:undecaprenyl-phosphate GlcNAc-1-phosphate transferase